MIFIFSFMKVFVIPTLSGRGLRGSFGNKFLFIYLFFIFMRIKVWLNNVFMRIKVLLIVGFHIKMHILCSILKGGGNGPININ